MEEVSFGKKRRGTSVLCRDEPKGFLAFFLSIRLPETLFPQIFKDLMTGMRTGGRLIESYDGDRTRIYMTGTRGQVCAYIWLRCLRVRNWQKGFHVIPAELKIRASGVSGMYYTTKTRQHRTFSSILCLWKAGKRVHFIHISIPKMK